MTTSTRRQRAFVLLIVVMLLAVLGVAVAVQLDTARGQSIESSRTRDDAAARAAAETCLDLLLAQTRGYLTSSTPPPPDFDPLLDPELDDANNVADADDFLPPALDDEDVVSSAVFVPKGSTRTSSHYRLYRFKSQGSACLVRFDDNSDDAVPSPLLPPAATSNNGVVEGPAGDSGRDILNRDRDRAIQLTAIGVFPAFASVVDDDVFDRAHARVTLRRVIETSGGPAIWAGDRVITAFDNAVCGLGGITADVLDKGSDSVCACGEQNLGSTPPLPLACDYTDAATPGTNCDEKSRACEPRVVGEVKRQIDPFDPSPAIDSPLEELLRDSGGDPDPEVDDVAWLSTATIGNPGTNGMCEFYVRQRDARNPRDPNGKTYGQTYFADNANLRAEVYVWNHLSAGLLPKLVDGIGLSQLTCVDLSGAVIPCNSTCDNLTAATMPRPCDFALSGGSMKATCGPGESACWQLLAQLDGVPTQTVGTPAGALGSAVSLAQGLGLNLVGFQEQTALGANTNEVWIPKGTSTGAGPVLALATTTLFNLLNSLGVTNVTTWDQLCNGGSTWINSEIVAVNDDGNIHKRAGWSTRNRFANESVVLFENPPEREVIVDGSADFGLTSQIEVPVKALIGAAGDVHFDGRLNLCCPSCNCPGENGQELTMPTVTASPSNTTDRVRPCSGTDSFTALMNPLAPLTDQPIKSRLAIRTGGHCLFEKESNVVGDVMCKTINIKGGGCFVSDLFAHGDCPGGVCACKGGPTCVPGHERNRLDRNDSGCDGVTGEGCEDPGVCIGNVGGGTAPQTVVVGATFSNGDVCVVDPLTTYGQVIAADDIRLTSHVYVNHDGTTGGGVGAIVSTVAWIEAAR